MCRIHQAVASRATPPQSYCPFIRRDLTNHSFKSERVESEHSEASKGPMIYAVEPQVTVPTLGFRGNESELETPWNRVNATFKQEPMDGF
jgi:hypothetical protein